MTKSINKLLANRSLPSFLKSRSGWVKLFEMKRSSEPHLHQIEPTNSCPYSCIMCPRTDKMKRSIGFMNLDLFNKVIDEVCTYSSVTREKEIELFHFGESLLHPQIMDMTDYAVSAGLKIVLSVNAPKFTAEKAEQLFKIGVRKIIISLDGYDSVSYTRLRGEHADYKQAVKNITEIADLHSRMKPKTELIVRMIILKDNVNHAINFKKNWEKHGMKVELRDFFPWGEKDMVKLGKFEKYPPFMPCPFPWQYVVVQWNGDVVACCRDYNGVNVMGNIKNLSLKEIWNGPIYEQFRKNMTTGDYDNSICPSCMDIYYREV